KRGIAILFFGLVTYLLYTNARELEWAQIGASLRKLPLTVLLPAALIAGLSYAVYSCYDLIGRRYAGHRLPTTQVLVTTFVSYAFNLSLGTWVGGIGFRHRLYSRLGLTTGEISRVIVFSMLTNWSGYLLLAGIAFLLRPLEIPEEWALGAGALQGVGAVLVALAVGYALLCGFSRRREWTVRGHVIELPSGRMALLQLLVSSINWLLMATMVYLLLQAKVAYVTVVAVLLIAAIAGVVAHIPAGLGVLESVFVTLLSEQVGRYDVLAALLAYRALYYLAPLAVAIAVYIFLEARISRNEAAAG
ncbi:MAG: lysylphosphatidylglycerol synthase domain-containing protein, partial [Burkholderiaceae bacterium]